MARVVEVERVVRPAAAAPTQIAAPLPRQGGVLAPAAASRAAVAHEAARQQHVAAWHSATPEVCVCVWGGGKSNCETVGWVES
mgnify:CR=1 FL=1